MLGALSHAIEARDPYSRGHAARVTAIAEGIARWLGWEEAQLVDLRLGGRLHDVGKLAVPERILTKAGPLDSEELEQVRRHPAAGARIVGEIRRARPALPYVLYHHERWDGTGYPTGRSELAIPEEARVLAVADAFDAMTSARAYKLPLQDDHALAEIERCSGTQFDPEIVRAFLEAWRSGAISGACLAVRAVGR